MNTRMMKRVWLGIGCSALVPLVLACCSKSDNAPAIDTASNNPPAASQPAKQPDPVTIRIHISDAYAMTRLFRGGWTEETV